MGLLTVSPNKSHKPLIIKLNFEAINNIAEYEAHTIIFNITLELGIEETKIYRDSILIIS